MNYSQYRVAMMLEVSPGIRAVSIETFSDYMDASSRANDAVAAGLDCAKIVVGVYGDNEDGSHRLWSYERGMNS